jgi:diazepam-binding inhibitor (GABA receptor modulating acyl-CoA-binding protein)
MADLKATFEKAVAESKQLPEKPDNMTLLKIYALYKQATEGDVEGKRPGFTDMVGRAKFDAWADAEGQERRRGEAGVRRPDRIAEVILRAGHRPGVA